MDKRKFGTVGAEFLELYLQRGFGCMTKSEIELQIFYLLKEKNVISSDSNYQISRELRIPEAKVKKLIYDSDLKYGKMDDKQMKDEFENTICEKRFKVENGKITINITNKLLQEYLANELAKNNAYHDTSFNRNLMVIHADAFVELLNNLYGEENIKKFNAQIEGYVRNSAKGIPAWKMFFTKALNKENAIDLIIAMVKLYSSGVFDSIITKIIG